MHQRCRLLTLKLFLSAHTHTDTRTQAATAIQDSPETTEALVQTTIPLWIAISRPTRAMDSRNTGIS